MPAIEGESDSRHVATGRSPGQLQHVREIRTKIDALLPIDKEKKRQQNSSKYSMGQPR